MQRTWESEDIIGRKKDKHKATWMGKNYLRAYGQGVWWESKDLEQTYYSKDSKGNILGKGLVLGLSQVRDANQGPTRRKIYCFLGSDLFSCCHLILNSLYLCKILLHSLPQAHIPNKVRRGCGYRWPPFRHAEITPFCGPRSQELLLKRWLSIQSALEGQARRASVSPRRSW